MRTALLLSIFLAFALSSCDKCEKTIIGQYIVKINPRIVVRDSQGNTVGGYPAKIEMQKTHCDGDPGQLITNVGFTSGVFGDFELSYTGSWEINITNEVDKVTVNYYVGEGQDELTFSETFNHDVLEVYANNWVAFQPGHTFEVVP